MDNYQKILDETINSLENIPRKKVLMHSCCAPCSSYVIEYLNKYFDLSMYFYNPNISPKEEFDYRFEELKRLVDEIPCENKPEIILANYENEKFEEIANGLENVKEGGERCFLCYALRLEKTAEFASENGFDYFCTTLSISPHKNAQKLNEIGLALQKKYGVKYLCSDFKKKNGYIRSIELSHEYNLYRQNYCGCIYSKKQAEIKSDV